MKRKNPVPLWLKSFGHFSQNQEVSAFQSFGTIFFGKKRTKIKAQPTAVPRKKSKICSQQS